MGKAVVKVMRTKYSNKERIADLEHRVAALERDAAQFGNALFRLAEIWRSIEPPEESS